jgi:dipeptidyl aminopeptidase/acylaminoacyl peptidase
MLLLRFTEMERIIMLPNNLKVAAILMLFSSLAWAVPRCDAQQTKKQFTVADDIGITLFRTIGVPPKMVRFSPDGNYFVVFAERGRLDLNRVEDSFRFYRSQDVEDFLGLAEESRPPAPLWVVTRSCKETDEGFIGRWRWLADSSGVAYLESTKAGSKHLTLADLRTKKVEVLTPETESVKDFDISDRQHYIYTVADVAQLQKRRDERQSAVIVGAGRSLSELLLPDDPVTAEMASPPNYLWAVDSGKRFELNTNGTPVVPAGGFGFALSPDGQSVVAELKVAEIPVSWGTLYLPSFASSPWRIRVGSDYVHQYVRINLQTGSVQSLTDAPVSASVDWMAIGSPSWSSDGRAILLPGTFLSFRDPVPSRPCVAVVYVPSNTRTCVEELKGKTETGYEEGYHLVQDVRFINGDEHRVMVSFYSRAGHTVTEYRSTGEGAWQVVGQRQSKGESELGHNGLEIGVEEAFDRPPTLVARKNGVSRVIWDPNPQLANIDLGQASVYKWKDKEGRGSRGLLYKPSNYKPGQRYPLVIQTHGFSEEVFDPAGGFPTASAARELAAVGIVVVQVGEGDCLTATPYERPCAVSVYEVVAKQLVSEGLVDPQRIGIIGFSRTGLYVMDTLTAGALHLKAASISDSTLDSYLQYMMFGPYPDVESMIGAKPFGEGLQKWLKESPTFNLHKIHTPLLINAGGPSNVLSMWEPYAGLHNLQKPVDLIMLNTDEHVLTNPAIRMASQGGSVDWFRFWLQDYEDPDPTKAEQYKRWHELRKMQDENDKKAAEEKTRVN